MTGFRLDEPKAAGTNRSVVSECEVCGGDQLVLVGRRPAKASPWMLARGFKASGEFEEYAPCPSCNADADTSFRRFDGTYVRRMDPGKTWELMSG